MGLTNVMVYVDPQQQEEKSRPASRKASRTSSAHQSLAFPPSPLSPPFLFDGVVIYETTEDDLKRMQAALAAKEEWFRRIVGLEKREGRGALGCRIPYRVPGRPGEGRGPRRRTRKQLKQDYYHYIDFSRGDAPDGPADLSVPERVAELSADSIVVGWKDAREARLAVRDALPFLARASRVTVIELCTSDEQDAARLRVRDVAKYLERYGASCQYEVHVHTAEPDARYLIRLARNEGADLIVTGGDPGHSRLGERMFGGMTRGLLQEAPICLVMSH